MSADGLKADYRNVKDAGEPVPNAAMTTPRNAHGRAEAERQLLQDSRGDPHPASQSLRRNRRAALSLTSARSPAATTRQRPEQRDFKRWTARLIPLIPFM
jgi:hypothetical protein